MLIVKRPDLLYSGMDFKKYGEKRLRHSLNIKLIFCGRENKNLKSYYVRNFIENPFFSYLINSTTSLINDFPPIEGMN